MNYKRFFILMGFVVLGGLFGAQLLHSKHATIIDLQGRPSKDLLELLSLTNIKHDSSLASIVQGTQASWIRKPGTERWDIVDIHGSDRDQFFKIFKKLNLINEINPLKKQYEYALWMGAAYPRIENRLAHLITLWQQGVRFNQLILLAGARPLTESEKSAMVIAYNLQDDTSLVTETDAMKLVYEKVAMPDEMRLVELIVIDVPMQVKEDGSLTRPTTGNTVDAWLSLQPLPGECLVISNQPYVGYQDAVTKTLLPTDFVVDTVGEKSEDKNIGIYLDTVARYLYQEKKRLQL